MLPIAKTAGDFYGWINGLGTMIQGLGAVFFAQGLNMKRITGAFDTSVNHIWQRKKGIVEGIEQLGILAVAKRLCNALGDTLAGARIRKDMCAIASAITNQRHGCRNGTMLHRSSLTMR